MYHIGSLCLSVAYINMYCISTRSFHLSLSRITHSSQIQRTQETQLINLTKFTKLSTIHWVRSVVKSLKLNKTTCVMLSIFPNNSKTFVSHTETNMFTQLFLLRLLRQWTPILCGVNRLFRWIGDETFHSFQLSFHTTNSSSILGTHWYYSCYEFV